MARENIKTKKKERPKVGLAVIVMKGGQVLFGKRKGSHGASMWAFPGGHLEYMESFDDCAERELLEETGLSDSDCSLMDLMPSAITNDYFPSEKKHYITLFMRSQYKSGKPERMEPDKCEEWKWFGWGFDKMPSGLFVPVRNLLNQGYNPFEKQAVISY